MYCRSCGKEVNDKAIVCVNCGTNPKEGKSFCKECGYLTRYDDAICGQCGCRVGNSSNSGLSQYYEDEFAKIEESDEKYTGKFNWFAFLFGGFWGFTKGLWLSAVISIGLYLLSVGNEYSIFYLLNIIYCVVYGFRGNYMYYKLVKQNKQDII